MIQSEDCDNETWTYQGYHLDKGSFVTAMVHFYRAEVTRANLWRSRLDTTTNWAVVTTAAVLTFSFSSAQNPHFVLLLVLFLVLGFLSTEARRYSYYALWSYRIRLLETEFFAKMVAPPFRPAADWGDILHDTLVTPRFLISRWSAIAVRYRRNYIWLVTLLVFSWTLKLIVHPYAAMTTADIVERAGIGKVIPGSGVLLTVGGIYIALGGLAIADMIRHRKPKATRPLGGAWHAETRRAQAHGQLAVVITTQRAAVARRLMQELARGVTALSGIGMYTGEARDVLLCAITQTQVTHLEAIVRAIDPDAFVIVAETTDVVGRGFQHEEPPV